MTTSQMTIGAFARATGLTAGALRFYADSAVLSPASVDDSSGYRYYSADQIAAAITIRQLREMAMPLDRIAAVLAGDTDAVDRHVTKLAGDARRAREIASNMFVTNMIEKEKFMITVNGPVFAAAVDRVLTATAHHPEHRVLAGVYFEYCDGALTLTATDRFRLATHTINTESTTPTDVDEWSSVVDGDEVRAALPSLRTQHRVEVSITDTDIVLGHARQRCRVLADEFPDHRAMLGGLPAPTTRVVVQAHTLARALENQPSEFVELAVSAGRVDVSALQSTREAPSRVGVQATVTGPDVHMAFAITTLYPAIASAVGPEVMIDVSGPALPVVVRSADDGDFTTLAMPVDRAGLLLSAS